MTPEEFAVRMREIANNTGDKEAAHCDADDLLCEMLNELGYGEGVRYFQAMEKWYA